MLRYLAWAWLIIIGVLMITPLGPVCIGCGGATMTYVLAGISIGLGVLNFAMGMRASS